MFAGDATQAASAAKQLCDHGKWLSHARPIKIADLDALGVKVWNYNQEPDVAETIWRLWTLITITFQSPVFKIFENSSTHLLKLAGQPGRPEPVQVPLQQADNAELEVQCTRCGAKNEAFFKLRPGTPDPAGKPRVPTDSKITCRKCGNVMDLTPLKVQLESQFGKLP